MLSPTSAGIFFIKSEKKLGNFAKSGKSDDRAGKVKMSEGFINRHFDAKYSKKMLKFHVFDYPPKKSVFFGFNLSTWVLGRPRCPVATFPASPLCPFPLLFPGVFPTNLEDFCPSF